MRYQSGERYLWNPVSRKIYKNLPEERVRLQLTDYLILRAGWSRNRISFELPVHLNRRESPQRADLVCYNQQVKPVLLAECKAEKINLGDRVAIQIARYARHINTPWWLVTNGLTDCWFEINQYKKPVKLKQPPETFRIKKKQIPANTGYWQDRAFMGAVRTPAVEAWTINFLNYYFIQRSGFVRYLDFKSSPLGFDMSHYYHVITIDQNDGKQIAITALQTPEDKTIITGIFSEKGNNKGMIVIEVDNLSKPEKNNTHIFKPNIHRKLNIQSSLAEPLKIEKHSTQFGTLPKTLMEVFNQRN